MTQQEVEKMLAALHIYIDTAKPEDLEKLINKFQELLSATQKRYYKSAIKK